MTTKPNCPAEACLREWVAIVNQHAEGDDALDARATEKRAIEDRASQVIARSDVGAAFQLLLAITSWPWSPADEDDHEEELSDETGASLVDAPETGGVGSRGGAKCERERELGYEAKAFIVSVTKGKTLAISFTGEVDDFGRRVATITAGGEDVGRLGIAAGRLRPYVFDGKRATMPKPKWCP